jgi:diketogulonate reductase-like aldo/keto reductase
LIIIDDSEQVANMYKENTILVEAWTPFGHQRKKDLWLNECVKIVEQLRISNPPDIRKVLRSVIDIHLKYH